jgi:hypothetical protein
MRPNIEKTLFYYIAAQARGGVVEKVIVWYKVGWISNCGSVVVSN